MSRFLPHEPLPPYSYVPGRGPHPIRDPQGHSFGVTPPRPATPDPERWRECAEYLRGLDLFNHGYYWEAHETWESLWHACGRRGTSADFLKGLIKLAAAGVKAREGRPGGVASHARRAAELFEQTAQRLGSADARYFGLRLADLIEFASDAPIKLLADATATDAVRIVFPFVLTPVADDKI